MRFFWKNILYNLIRHLSALRVSDLMDFCAAKCHLLLRKEKEYASHTMCYKFHIVCGRFGCPYVEVRNNRRRTGAKIVFVVIF